MKWHLGQATVKFWDKNILFSKPKSNQTPINPKDFDFHLYMVSLFILVPFENSECRTVFKGVGKETCMPRWISTCQLGSMVSKDVSWIFSSSWKLVWKQWIWLAKNRVKKRCKYCDCNWFRWIFVFLNKTFQVRHATCNGALERLDVGSGCYCPSLNRIGWFKVKESK